MSTKTAPAPKADDTAGAEPEKQIVVAPLLRDGWRPRESGVLFGEHEIVPPAGTPPKHLEAPAFWANIAQKLKPGDMLHVFPEDGAYRAQLHVWDVGQNWAHVQMIMFGARPDFGPAPGSIDDFEIGFGGPIKKHRVIRKSDKAELKSGFATAEDARRWLIDHKLAMSK